MWMISNRSAVLPSASAWAAKSAAAAASPTRPNGRRGLAGELVGRAHRAQVRDQIEQRGDSGPRPRRVDHRQREAGAEQQIARGAHVDLRVDSGRGAAPFRLLARAHRPRSRGRLPAPAKAARNRPSGLSARRIRTSAPGRSLTVSSRPTETTRSKRGRALDQVVLPRLRRRSGRSPRRRATEVGIRAEHERVSEVVP